MNIEHEMTMKNQCWIVDDDGDVIEGSKLICHRYRRA